MSNQDLSLQEERKLLPRQSQPNSGKMCVHPHLYVKRWQLIRKPIKWNMEVHTSNNQHSFNDLKLNVNGLQKTVANTDHYNCLFKVTQRYLLQALAGNSNWGELEERAAALVIEIKG